MPQNKNHKQSYISITPGRDETELGFSWYFDAPGTGVLSFIKKDEYGSAPTLLSAEGVRANDRGQYSYQVTACVPERNTEYLYWLTNDCVQSEVMSFRTGKSGGFSFAVVGDPQLDSHAEKSNVPEWKKTLGIIAGHEYFRDVSFILSTGDQVEEYNDEDDYAAYLEHDEMRRFPVATAIGNHETDSPLYHLHFNVANFSGIARTDAGTNNHFTYNGVLFVVLNTNIYDIDEHRRFLLEVMPKFPDVRWRIAVFHNSVFTTGKHGPQANLIAFREKLVPVLTEFNIDVVINGHDHIYCRSFIMDGLKPVTDPALYGKDYSSIADPPGILYLTFNSASGIKGYDVTGVYDYDAVSNQEHIPNVSRVDISDGRFHVITYRTTDMSVVDEFTIFKNNAENLK